ncbi:MAG TPA: DUF2807 domain-containing protein [Caulobacteraceae bacterium]|jgi:hypothetical protein|nr:DUF2807 domain-containing protein [Caulobacteraceae bacterium]
MRAILAFALAVAALAGAGAAVAQTVEFRNVAARVTIIPEPRSDVQVIVLKTNPRLPLHVDRSLGGRVVVSGGDWWSWLFGPKPSCRGDASVYVPSVGDVASEDLPQIAVRVPMDADVDAGGVIYGSVGRSHSLHLRAAGCGAWTVANVEDRLDVVLAGADRLHTGAARAMALHIAGASEATTTAVANGFTVEIAGVGDVHVGQASGPVGVHMAGGGDVRIDGGDASALDVHIAGSGSVAYGGTAGSLDAHIAGSGDIRAAKVTGAVNRFIAGSGTVIVGQ